MKALPQQPTDTKPTIQITSPRFEDAAANVKKIVPELDLSPAVVNQPAPKK